MPSRAARKIYYLFAFLLSSINSRFLAQTEKTCFFYTLALLDATCVTVISGNSAG